MNKKHIIDEIIRTAKGNNGVPLGKDKFASETGIKFSDWYGKYWAKWGDAVREAGFKPNKLNSAYEQNVLIGHIISLIREIKKFPTAGDIRLKAYTTKGFPSHSVFSRLWKKPEMAQKILNYCKNNSGYEDVIEICKGVLDSSGDEERDVDSQEAEPQFGYVYLMKLGKYYKIGRTNDPVEKRNYEIGLKFPENPKTIHEIKTDDPIGIEAYWHKRFEDKKVRDRTEWFDLSSSDVKVFRKRKFM